MGVMVVVEGGELGGSLALMMNGFFEL